MKLWRDISNDEKILAYLNKKDSELKNLKAMCDSLYTFKKEYGSIKYLYSEVASFEEINKKYELIKQEGKLYTFKVRENEE